MATKEKAKAKVFGYLPNDTPPFGQMVLLGFQHVLTMFPATVLVALLMGFPVPTVLLISGVGTILALLGSKLTIGKYIPLYYGSSFSYLAAVMAITKTSFGELADPHLLSVVQAGFIATGVINIIVGILIRVAGGKKAIDIILPPSVTGPVACSIGIGLGLAALNNATGITGPTGGPQVSEFIVALLTLVITICFSVYLQGKGFIGMLPILLGAIAGYLIAIPFGLVNITWGNLLRVPTFNLPVFNDPMTLTAIVGIGIMAIATIPESTAHLYQISLYVDHLAEQQGREKYNLSQYIGLNFILDGLDDIVNGLFGSVAGTNYGENNSLMVITRNYSGPALITAGVIAILLAFVGPLADIVQSMPSAVGGGLSIYLFGVIGMQGIALMISEKVNLYDPRQLAIGAVILIVGIGGNIGFANSMIPFPVGRVFPDGLPAIAFAAVLGILINLIFVIIKPPADRQAVNK